MNKREIINEISELIESDPDSVPMSLEVLDILSEDELRSVRENLLKSKANRSKENDKWFDELVSKENGVSK